MPFEGSARERFIEETLMPSGDGLWMGYDWSDAGSGSFVALGYVGFWVRGLLLSLP
jgi:hypothetical protein